MFVRLVILSASIVVSGGLIAEDAHKVVPVDIVGQETGVWCWAASAQMIMQSHGVSVSQCRQANERFGERLGCCGQETPTECIRIGWPQFDKFSFDFRRTDGMSLTWSQVKDEIDAERPFAWTWRWKNAPGGHMVVINGYRTEGTKKFVNVLDPLPIGVGDEYEITFDDYIETAQKAHWDDYYFVQLKSDDGPGGGPKNDAKQIAEAAASTRARILGIDAPGALPDEVLDAPLPVIEVVYGVSKPEFKQIYSAVLRGEPSAYQDKLIFPVKQSLASDASNVGGIALQKLEKEWTFASAGNKRKIGLLSDLRRRLMQIQGLSESSFQVIEFVALNRTFIRYAVDGKVRFVSLVDDKQLKLLKNQEVDGDELLRKLTEVEKLMGDGPG